jgi:hypothetical protein
MSNIRRNTAVVTYVAAIAVLTLGIAVTGARSAFADYGVVSQSPAQARSWHAYPYATNRLELAYPELARQFGSNPGYWPTRAFRNIDCDLPSSGCPNDMRPGTQ